MALTGTFLADFESFTSEGAKAEAALDRIQGGGAKVEAQINRLSDSGAIAFKRLGEAGAGATTEADNLRGAFSKVDGVLGALGVNLTHEVKAIEDLAGAAGKTATELGAFATAGLVVGAAMLGWKLGEKISEVTGLGKAISDTTARLLGWGDVAAQEAGAGADAIALAFQRTGVHAKDAAEALALNTKWLKEHNVAAKQTVEANKDAAKAHEEWAKAMVELNSAGTSWKGTLDTIDGRVVEAIKGYLDAGVSQSVLATAYGLTATQVKAVASALSRETDEQKQATAAAAAAKKQQDEFTGALDRVAFATLSLQEQIDTIDGTTAEWAKDLLRSGASASDVATVCGLTAQQVAALEKATARESATAEKSASSHDVLGRAIHKVGDETQRAMELTGKWYDLQGRKVTSVQSDITSENYRTLGYGGYEGLFREGYSLQEAIAIASGAPKGPPRGPRVPGFQTGVEDYAGGWAMVGERGPEAMYVPPHASIFKSGSAVGGGGIAAGAIVINLYGTPASLAAQVDAIITRKVLQGMKVA